MSEHMSPIPSRLYNAAVGGHVAGADQIVDDETGLTLDKVAGGALEEKEYTSGSDNGMGRVVLRKNLVNGVNTLVQTMINKSNTIYVIQYNFTLGEDITVPANCVLKFDGGSISGNNTITGNNTGIVATPSMQIFSGVDIQGTWNVTDIYIEWMNIPNRNECRIPIQSICRLQNDNIYQNIIFPDYELAHTPIGGYTNALIFLSSNTHLQIKNVVRVNSNNLQTYWVVGSINKKNIIVDGGGTIIGDVDTHDYSGGGTSEFGHGVVLLNCKNGIVRDLTTTKLTGDGVNISGDDENTDDTYDTASQNILIENIKSSYNGRQGISVIHCKGIVIRNCEITNIGNASAAPNGPWAGIDFEPMYPKAWTRDVLVDNCFFENNIGSDITFYGSPIKNVTIRDCNMSYPNESYTESNKCQLTGRDGIKFDIPKGYGINIENCAILGIGYDSFQENTMISVTNCKICQLVHYANNPANTNVQLMFDSCVFDERRVIGASAFNGNVFYINSPSKISFKNCFFDFTGITPTRDWLYYTSEYKYSIDFLYCTFKNFDAFVFDNFINCITDTLVKLNNYFEDVNIENCILKGGMLIIQNGNKTTRIINNDIQGFAEGSHIFWPAAEISWQTNLVVKNNSFNDTADLTVEESFIRQKVSSLIWKGNN